MFSAFLRFYQLLTCTAVPGPQTPTPFVNPAVTQTEPHPTNVAVPRSGEQIYFIIKAAMAKRGSATQRGSDIVDRLPGARLLRCSDNPDSEVNTELKELR